MLERHYVRPSGFKSDRDWWIATKAILAVVIGAAGAYVVHVTIL